MLEKMMSTQQGTLVMYVKQKVFNYLMQIHNKKNGSKTKISIDRAVMNLKQKRVKNNFFR